MYQQPLSREQGDFVIFYLYFIVEPTTMNAALFILLKMKTIDHYRDMSSWRYPADVWLFRSELELDVLGSGPVGRETSSARRCMACNSAVIRFCRPYFVSQGQ